MPLDGTRYAHEGQAERVRTVLRHHQEPVRSGAGHHAIEQMHRRGDGAGGEVVRHRHRRAQQRLRIALGIGALRYREHAEILPRRTGRAHIGIGDQREAGIRAAGAVRIDRVARKTAETGKKIAKARVVRGVAGDAGDYLRVAILHGTRGAAQRDHAAGTAHRQPFQEARRQADLLGEADRGVGGQREAGDAEAVDLGLGHAARVDQPAQRTRQEPRRTLFGAPDIGLGHRAAEGDAVIAACGHRRFSPRVSMQPPRASISSAIAFKAPRATFWLAVSGSASTKPIQPGTLK